MRLDGEQAELEYETGLKFVTETEIVAVIEVVAAAEIVEVSCIVPKSLELGLSTTRDCCRGDSTSVATELARSVCIPLRHSLLHLRGYHPHD